MSLDPISGPVPREEFRKMADLPAGEAAKAIRKYDPLFGRDYDEDVLTWMRKFTRAALETGFATVEARTKEEAEAKANKLGSSFISWDADYNSSGSESLESVEPRP